MGIELHLRSADRSGCPNAAAALIDQTVTIWHLRVQSKRGWIGLMGCARKTRSRSESDHYFIKRADCIAKRFHCSNAAWLAPGYSSQSAFFFFFYLRLMSTSSSPAIHIPPLGGHFRSRQLILKLIKLIKCCNCYSGDLNGDGVLRDPGSELLVLIVHKIEWSVSLFISKLQGKLASKKWIPILCRSVVQCD